MYDDNNNKKKSQQNKIRYFVDTYSRRSYATCVGHCVQKLFPVFPLPAQINSKLTFKYNFKKRVNG